MFPFDGPEGDFCLSEVAELHRHRCCRSVVRNVQTKDVIRALKPGKCSQLYDGNSVRYEWEDCVWNSIFNDWNVPTAQETRVPVTSFWPSETHLSFNAWVLFECLNLNIQLKIEQYNYNLRKEMSTDACGNMTEKKSLWCSGLKLLTEGTNKVET